MVLEDTKYFSTKFWYLKKNLVRDRWRRIRDFRDRTLLLTEVKNDVSRDFLLGIETTTIWPSR